MNSILASGRGPRSFSNWLSACSVLPVSLQLDVAYESRRPSSAAANVCFEVSFPRQPSRSLLLALVLAPMNSGSRLISWSARVGASAFSETHGEGGAAVGVRAMPSTTKRDQTSLFSPPE